MAEKQNRGPPQSEFVVKVLKKPEHKRFSIIKFNGNLSVDTSKWSSDGSVTLEREDNKGQVLSSQPVQEYGEGSEYGKAAREEARRKKYGRQARNYHLDNQPWRLTFNDTDGRERKMRSIRECGASNHADYWVFLKSGDEFHAYKVDDWHKFLPCITHKTLDIDQAEEQFQQRSRVMNQFALKAQILKTVNAAEEDGEQMIKAGKSLKIKDEASDESGSDDEEKEGGEEKQERKKRKKKGEVKPRKDKKQRVENGDEVAKYESEDGEDEGREYDYMSDSGSDSDRDNVPMEDKIEKALVGVGDETGLKKMMDSDGDDSSDDDDDPTKKLLNKGDEEGKEKRHMDIEDRDSSGSDSDDPDKEKMDSVLFMSTKDAPAEGASSSSSRKRAAAEEAVAHVNAQNEAKKVKTEEERATSSGAGGSGSADDGLTEETVRKYLRRKPHTTKELLSKIKNKCGDMSKQDIVTKLAAILKAIEPHQFKQKQGKKDVLFFSLQNTV